MSNLSFVRHVGDGSTTQFALAVAGENIGYFRTSDIHGYVDDVEVAITINAASPHLVIINPAPKKGADVLLRREMPLDKPYANFERGNNFGHRQVNNTFVQQLYLQQEMLDGFLPKGYYLKQELDAGLHKIKNMAQATSKGDAVEHNQWYDKNVVQDDRLLSLEQSLTAGNLVYRRVVFTATEGQTEFNPNATFGGILNLYINGVNQIAGEAYESIDGRLIKTVPLDEGDRVVAIIGQEPQFVEPEQTDFRYVRYPFFATGGETTYVLPADAKQVMSLYINGIHQTYQGAFDFDASTRTVNFAEALEGGDEVVVYAGSESVVEGDASNLPVTSLDGSLTSTLRSWVQNFVDFGDNRVIATGSTTSRSLSDRFADVVRVADFELGATSDYEAIKRAHDYANIVQRPVEYERRTYTIDRIPESIRVLSDVNFNNATLRFVEGAKGKISLYSIDTLLPERVMPASTVSVIQSSLYEDAVNIPSLAATSYTNSYLLIENDELLAHRQGYTTDFYKTDPVILLENGNMTAPLLCDHRTGNLTITEKPLESTWLTFGKLTVKLDYTTDVDGAQLVVTRRHSTLFHNIRFENIGTELANPTSLIAALEVAYTMFYNVDGDQGGVDSGAGYMFSYQKCIDTHFDKCGAGGGWGVTNSNWQKNTIITLCDLNRFDAHFGIGDVTISDSSFYGYGAQLAFGRGNFTCNRVTFNQTEGSNINGFRALQFRADTGLGYKGKINMNDCVLNVMYTFDEYRIPIVYVPAFQNVDANPTVDWYLPDIHISNLRANYVSRGTYVHEVKVSAFVMADTYDVPNKIHLPDIIEVDGMSSNYKGQLLGLNGCYFVGTNLDNVCFETKTCNVYLRNIHNDITHIDKDNLDASFGSYAYDVSLFDFGGTTNNIQNSNVRFVIDAERCTGSIYANTATADVTFRYGELLSIWTARNFENLIPAKVSFSKVWARTKSSDTEYYLADSFTRLLVENCEIIATSFNGVTATKFDPLTRQRLQRCYISADSSLDQLGVDALWNTIETVTDMYKKPTT
ncbi:tail fiber protein (endogenous virus) [Gutovirus Vc1]|uniref:Tail fiber protein n=1 Tax=Vibrio phage Vc1 TaxID=1480731 RepID=X2L0B8_9CAUD|nr:tail fiber protein [Vibrio phage Vc1]AHN84664.1 tail fiber protein [Vibrio phage Vc1]